MTTCNGDHATIDELIDCPPCDAFLSDCPPLYTVYALWEGTVADDIYDGDDWNEACEALTAYIEALTADDNGTTVHLYEPAAGALHVDYTHNR